MIDTKIEVVKSKIRMNELAHELRCKANDILAILPGLGVTEKKSHSSSLSYEVAQKVRAHFAANPTAREPQIDSKSFGLMKSIAARFGEEI
jgi:translation initiation factor IF-2